MQAGPDSRALHKHRPNNAVPRVSSTAQTSFHLLKVALISAVISRDKIPYWQWTAYCYTQDSILLCVLLSQVLVLGQKPTISSKKPQTSLKCETHLSCTKSFNQNWTGIELQVLITQEQPQKKKEKGRDKNCRTPNEFKTHIYVRTVRQFTALFLKMGKTETI